MACAICSCREVLEGKEGHHGYASALARAQRTLRRASLWHIRHLWLQDPRKASPCSRRICDVPLVANRRAAGHTEAQGLATGQFRPSVYLNLAHQWSKVPLTACSTYYVSAPCSSTPWSSPTIPPETRTTAHSAPRLVRIHLCVVACKQRHKPKRHVIRELYLYLDACSSVAKYSFYYGETD